LDDPTNDGTKKAEAEIDRLLHRRKAVSGSEFAGVGMQFGATIVIAALAGVWLDKRLGTTPWFVILMVFGGAAAGFWSMYRRLVRAGKGGR
jgi:F0F1-type ATP synthase assembly protein I